MTIRNFVDKHSNPVPSCSSGENPGRRTNRTNPLLTFSPLTRAELTDAEAQARKTSTPNG